MDIKSALLEKLDKREDPDYIIRQSKEETIDDSNMSNSLKKGMLYISKLDSRMRRSSGC